MANQAALAGSFFFARNSKPAEANGNRLHCHTDAIARLASRISGPGSDAIGHEDSIDRIQDCFDGSFDAVHGNGASTINFSAVFNFDRYFTRRIMTQRSTSCTPTSALALSLANLIISFLVSFAS